MLRGVVDGGVQVPAASRRAQVAGLDELLELRGQGVAEVGAVAQGERELVGGAEQVRGQHVGVLRRDEGVLHRPAVEELRVAHEVLVEGVVTGDEDRQRRLAATAAAARLLPRAGDAAGVAGEHRGVQAADVHAELQGVGGGDAEQLTLAQPLLDAAAVLGHVVSAVGREAVGQHGLLLGHHVTRRAEDELRRAARAHKGDGADTGPRGLGEEAGGLAVGLLTDARLGVAEGRVPEEEALLAEGGAAVGDGGEGLAGEVLGELDGVADGGRAEDEAGLGAVAGADSAEAAQEQRHVGAEDAAVRVGLVDDDGVQALQEGGPALVVGQDAGVQHVRVGEEHVGRSADARALVVGGVAVVDREGRRGPRRGKLAEGGELVLRQRFGGVEEQGARRPVLQPLVEDGGLEAEALAAGGGGGDDDVLALQRGVDGGGLVRVEGPATELHKPRFEGGVQRVLEGLLDGVAWGQGTVVDHLAVVPRQPAQPVEEGLDVHAASVARGPSAFAGPRGGCTAARLFPWPS